MGVHGFFVATMRVTGCCVPFNINGFYPFLLTCLSEAFGRTGIPFNKIVHGVAIVALQSRPVLLGRLCISLAVGVPSEVNYTRPSDRFWEDSLPHSCTPYAVRMPQHGRPFGATMPCGCRRLTARGRFQIKPDMPVRGLFRGRAIPPALFLPACTNVLAKSSPAVWGRLCI